MRIIGLIGFLVLSAVAQAAKLDKAVYPNANIYLEPASRSTFGYAKVIREYCPGGGRGLIHFLGLDGNLIRIRKTWPTYLEVAPGQREFEMEYLGTSGSIWGTWEGTGKVSANLEVGKTYVIRYQRMATDAFRVWVEPYTGFEKVDMNTVFCEQSPFPDTSLHQ